MSLQGRRVLVTGAGGFIGSHLVEHLVSHGAVVRTLVHYNALGRSGWLDSSPCRDHVEIVVGELCDRDSVAGATKGAEVVFHLGALIAIPYSYQAPLSFIKTNVEGTLNVLQAAREANVVRVVHTSTSEVYGTARRVPIDESHRLQAQSPYAASKIAADKLAETFYLSYGLPVVTVRPFNTFGPRQSARAVVPTIVTQCIAGKTVRLGNVGPTRDLNYVTDIVDGFYRAAIAPEVAGRTINLGSGLEISIRDVVDLVANLMGREVETVTEPVRVRPATSEVERLVADNALARSLLGWRPTISLEEGLRRTIDWFEKHMDSYQTGVYVI